MSALDIFIDPVCPWCYLAKAQLDRALEAHPDHPFRLEWHPFQLYPDMPATGVNKAEFLSRRLGGPAQLAEAHRHLRAMAAQAGLALDPDRPQRIPNTLDAHRLIHWAGLEGRQTPVVAALFRAYWAEGRDIGDAGVLADLAAEAGMGRTLAARLLAGAADREAVLAREAHARARGVRAVPTFVIANRYVVAGAQPPEFWAEVIGDLAGKGAAE